MTDAAGDTTSRPVDRCICNAVTFSRALHVARLRDVRTVEELQDHVSISDNCRLCRPYVQRTIETGEIAHAVMTEGEADAFDRRSRHKRLVEETSRS